MTGELRVHLLGGFRVEVATRAVADDAWRLRKARNLVKLLALAPGHRLHREQVMDALWPDLDPRAAGNQLRKALHVARRAIDPSPEAADTYLRHRDDLLVLENAWVDVDAFEAAAEGARRDGNAGAYESAISLYEGDLLPEDQYEDWVIRRKEELRTDLLALLVDHAGMLEARADLDTAISVLQRVVDIDPLREEAHVLLMRVYALGGRRQDAIRQFDQLRDILQSELDTEPDVAAKRLYEEIRAGDASEPDLAADLWERVGELRVYSDSSGAAYAFQAAAGSLPADHEPVRAAALHRKAARALLMDDDWKGAEPHINAAQEILRNLDDEAERGRLLVVRAIWHWQRDELEEAQQAVEEGLEIAERLRDADDLASAHEALAIVLHFRGNWRDGLEVEIKHVGAAADQDPQLARVFDVYQCLGEYHLYGDGLFPQVEEYARQTIDLATQKGARRAQAFAWCLLGESLLLRGYWDEAEGCLEKSTELHAELGTRSGALPWQRLGELHVYRGKSDAADAHVRRGMAISTVSPLALHVWARLYATQALDALERDEPAEAVRAVRGAASAAVRYGECPTCATLLHPIAAEAYAAAGEVERAQESAARAKEVAELWESSAWRAMAESAEGAVLLAQGDPDAAAGRFLSAAELYERAEQPFWAARSQMQAALAGGGSERATHLEEALEVFTRLGAVRAEEHARAALEEKALAKHAK